MANPTLNWRYVGTLTFVSSISNALDAAYTLGTSVTYADGAARVPGAGSAWTWNREVAVGPVTVAAYGVPPVNALGFSFIIGGTVGASAYTFLTPDTAALANCIVYGMNRSSGAYTTWTSATPFTNAGGFSGYWRGTRILTTFVCDSVAMWESQEGCVLQFGVAASGTTQSIGLGALFDPLSTAPLNAEADGRLYSIWGSGSNAVTNGGWAQIATGADGTAWAGGATNAICHAGTFAPGTNVMLTGAGSQTYRFGTFIPTAAFTSTNGDIARVPIVGYNALNNFVGQSRQWYITKDSISRLTWTNGATVIGYIWAATLNTSTDAIVMTY